MTNYGSGRIRRSGYWYLLKKDHPFSGKQGYIAEHRLVMESHIGRSLKRGEVVHHINRNISDNRIENLQLFSSPGEHTKIAHPEILEARKGLTITKKVCSVCGTEFEVTWHKIHKITCSEECRHISQSKKMSGREANEAQIVGLSFGHGWNKGLPMTWQARGKDNVHWKHGRYSKYR